MKMAIVTGATRGLGEAIASGLVEKGVGLINISRRDNENLKAMATDAGVTYSFHPCDLTSATDTEQVFREVGASVFSSGADTIYVISIPPLYLTVASYASRLQCVWALITLSMSITHVLY